MQHTPHLLHAGETPNIEDSTPIDTHSISTTNNPGHVRVTRGLTRLSTGGLPCNGCNRIRRFRPSLFWEAFPHPVRRPRTHPRQKRFRLLRPRMFLRPAVKMRVRRRIERAASKSPLFVPLAWQCRLSLMRMEYDYARAMPAQWVQTVICGTQKSTAESKV